MYHFLQYQTNIGMKINGLEVVYSYMKCKNVYMIPVHAWTHKQRDTNVAL